MILRRAPLTTDLVFYDSITSIMLRTLWGIPKQ